MKTITLRSGKERSLQRRHPWVFEGSIASGKADPGETVRVQAADGSFVAWASYSPQSMIRLRAWSFVESERIDTKAEGVLPEEVQGDPIKSDPVKGDSVKSAVLE